MFFFKFGKFSTEILDGVFELASDVSVLFSSFSNFFIFVLDEEFELFNFSMLVFDEGL